MSDASSIQGLLPLGPRAFGITSQQGLGQPLGSVTLELLPSSLQSLNHQILLSGQIQSTVQPGQQGSNGAGNLFILSTDAGDVLIRSGLNLRAGQDFLLQIPAGSPPRGAVLLTPVLGAGPAGAELATAGGQGTAVGATAAAAAETVPLPSAATFNTPAVLPQIQPGISAAAQLLPNLPAGQITATSGAASAQPTAIAGNPPPASASPTSTVPAASGATTVATPGSASPATGAGLSGHPIGAGNQTPPPTSFLGALLSEQEGAAERPASAWRSSDLPNAAPARPLPLAPQAGNQALTPTSQPFAQASQLGDVRIVNILPPGHATPPGSLNAEGLISATVVQSSAEGPTLLKLGEQTLLLNARGSVEPGTRLLLQLPTSLASGSLNVPASDPMLAQGRWQALNDAQQFLQAIQSNAIQNLNASIPQIGQTNLATAIMFFMVSLRLGDFRAWLGENTIRTLEKFGQAELLDGLKDDFDRLAKQADEPVSGGWRGYTVPISQQNDIGLAQFFIRPIHPDGRGSGNEETGVEAPPAQGTRFLVDLDMSQLGALQIDGLSHERRIDVILRARRALPAEMRQELHALYQRIIEARGLQGDLSFRNDAEGWITLTRHRTDKTDATGNGRNKIQDTV